MKTLHFFCFFLISSLFLTESMAQVTMTPAEARAQLEAKGISEEELRARLMEKGYDIDNIQPDQVEEFQQVLVETIEELEQEKALEESDTRRMSEDDMPSEEERDPPDEPAEPPVEAPIQEEIPEPEVDTGDAIIYGHHLFTRENLRVFRSSEDIKPSDSYVLGVGDEITVTIWGLSQYDATFEIDRSGFIRPQNMPRIALKGLTYGKARALLRDRFSNFYVFRPGEFELVVNYSRKITVNVYGEAKVTGSLTLPAINTVFNVLAAAGGPTGIGTVRNIRLISGSDEKRFDLYAFMNNPVVAEEFYLRENDYVHIPEAERVVSISGAVKRPYRYELVAGENLKSLLDYAGGVTYDAYLKDIQIARYTNDERILINLDLRELLSGEDDFVLYAGDEITIRSIETEAENYVEITGEVVKPGRYELKPGMRLADLVALSRLRPEAKRDYAYLLRYNPDGTYAFRNVDLRESIDDPQSNSNLELQPKDRVSILSLTSFVDSTTFSITGAVRSPGAFDFNPTGAVKVTDALLISGGLKPGAADFAYIIRQDPSEPKRLDYIPFNVRAALNDPTGSQNILLEAFDEIRIFDLEDFRDELTIKVSGAVRKPGVFRYDANMTVTDALNLAGGLTFSASTNKVDISRIFFSENNPTTVEELTIDVRRDLHLVTTDSVLMLLPFDHIYVRQVPEFELEKVVSLRGEVRYPGDYAIVADNERISSLIERAGGLTLEAFPEGAILYRAEDSIGAVVIQLDEALNRPLSAADVIIKDADSIFVPKQKDLVTIQGAINVRDLYPDAFIQKGNRIHVVYEKNRNARYYVDNYAAGVAKNGLKRLITVEHPNGRVEKTKNFGLFKIYPKVDKGSRITVGFKPVEPEEEKERGEPVDWSNVIRDTIAQATAVLTLILLIDRTNN